MSKKAIVFERGEVARGDDVALARAHAHPHIPDRVGLPRVIDLDLVRSKVQRQRLIDQVIGLRHGVGMHRASRRDRGRSMASGTVRWAMMRASGYSLLPRV